MYEITYYESLYENYLSIVYVVVPWLK